MAMVNSVHTARWIAQLQGTDWDLHLFPCDNAPAWPSLSGVTVHRPWRRLPPLKHWVGQVLKRLGKTWNNQQDQDAADLAVNQDGQNRTVSLLPLILPHELDTLLCKRFRVQLGDTEVRLPRAYGPRQLARVIARVQPDLIHTLEFQHNAYRMLLARDHTASTSGRWLATNWGSDLLHYRQFPPHLSLLRAVLKRVDYYTCECARDLALARELGLNAPTWPVLPNTGGFDLDQAEDLRNRIPPSQRSRILIKGYQHFAGRALKALDALALCTLPLDDFHIQVYSPSREVRQRATELERTHGMLIHFIENSSHEQMLAHFAAARVYLGISASDGISTSLLEALALGAFPIQSNSACCDEWFEDGIGGIAVDWQDAHQIARAMERALSDDALVDQAAQTNWRQVVQRLDRKRLRIQVQELYTTTMTDSIPPS